MAADWILVPCLDELRDEFNLLGPGRDHASDGSIGNAAHAASESDHNPDETGATGTEDADSRNEVHAIDVDDSGPWINGFTLDAGVELIRSRHADGRDSRLQNIIRNGRIASRSWGWTWRDYTGSNGHYEHAHFSARYDTGALEDDRRPWGLVEKWGGVSVEDVLDALESTRGKAAIFKALLDQPYGSGAYEGRTLRAYFKDSHAKRDYEIGDGKGAALSGVKVGSFLDVVGKMAEQNAAQVAAILQAIAAGHVTVDVDLLAAAIVALQPPGTLTEESVERALRNVLRQGVDETPAQLRTSA